MNMFYDGRRGKEKAEEDLTTSKESNIKNDKKVSKLIFMNVNE